VEPGELQIGKQVGTGRGGGGGGWQEKGTKNKTLLIFSSMS
jgi:hypothetical protein